VVAAVYAGISPVAFEAGHILTDEEREAERGKIAEALSIMVRTPAQARLMASGFARLAERIEKEG